MYVYKNDNRRVGGVRSSQKRNIDAIHQSNSMNKNKKRHLSIDINISKNKNNLHHLKKKKSNFQTGLVKWCLFYNEYAFVELIFFYSLFETSEYQIQYS